MHYVHIHIHYTLILMHCIGPDGQPDGSTCLASQGSDAIFSRILGFVNGAQWAAVETDGPFEGETCAATNHSHHQSLGDSVYWNWKRNMEFYHELSAKGVYINVSCTAPRHYTPRHHTPRHYTPRH
jgi:hypothetical protein